MERIPKQFTQGDTLPDWTESDGDYLASDGWTAKYQLTGPEQNTITSVADGDDHAFNDILTKTGATPWSAGFYKYQRFVVHTDGTKHTLENGTLEILTDISTIEIGDGYEGRTHARIMVDALEAVMQSRATKAQSELEIAGRRLAYLSPADLRKEYLNWKAILLQEEEAARISEGLGGRKIAIRFDRVT